MKEINLQMDGNGHITTDGFAGVMGDHNAALLSITLDRLVNEVGYYRLFFSGAAGAVMTEELFAENGVVRYRLPEKVTGLGNTVLCQLRGYAGAGGNFSLVFRSDTVPLTFGTTLPETDQLVDNGLTDRLEEIIDQAETIAKTFDVTIGKVTSLDYGQEATASLERSGEGMAYTLNLGLPRGEKGEGDFAQGDRVTIENAVISVDSTPGVYQGLANDYGYQGILENRTVAQLAGKVFWMNPIYNDYSTDVSFFTSGEGIYYRLYCYDGTQLTNRLPAGSIRAGRLMALYVDENETVIYLNPYDPPVKENPLPVYTGKVINPDSAFPQIEPDGLVYEDFINGKTILMVTDREMSLQGNYWYGPLLSTLEVFNGTNWVSTAGITGQTIPAGRALLLYLEFDRENYAFTCRFLNPPPYSVS